MRSSSSSTSTTFSWSSSQFMATSTQLSASDAANLEFKASKHVCDEERSNCVIGHAVVPTVIRSVENNPTKLNTVTTAQSSYHPPSSYKNPCGSKGTDVSVADCPLDVSISDDLLASLAEPDDLLDSQACLELLQSPDDHAASSYKSGKHGSQDKLVKDGVTNTKSNQLDHLNFLLIDPEAVIPEKHISAAKATSTKGKIGMF